MKAFFCKECVDIRVITKDNPRTCECGKCIAYFKNDSDDVLLSGPAIPLWFPDNSFARAVYNQGRPFEGHSIDTTDDTNRPIPGKGNIEHINSSSSSFSSDFEKKMKQ